MIRKIIKIDKELCNGCGLCVNACHEGAIVMVDNKATLLRDDYCDGLGNCLPVCPTNAISFEEREALIFNEEEVNKNIARQKLVVNQGCPGSLSMIFSRTEEKSIQNQVVPTSSLNQWPIQIQLVPTNAAYFNQSHLLIAADCTAFSYGNFHNEFMKNKITLIGCPKLDEVNYSDKLTTIFTNNDIKTITVVRMIVPCCGGIVSAVMAALKNSNKSIPLQVVTISTDGAIVNM